MLAVGAGVGLALGVLSLILIGIPDDDQAWLERAALLLPTVVYVVWWFIDPNLQQLADEPVEDDQTPPADVRIERIESVFDEAAVPRARRERPTLPQDSPRRNELRASIRRDEDAAAEIDPESFGVRRPTRHVEQTGTTPAPR